MNKKTAWFGAAILLGASALLSGTVNAQGGPPPDGPRSGPGGHMGGPGEEMRFLGVEAGMGEKNVTGAPFTASFTAVTSQTLADGNKIERTTSGTIARDSSGRVRRDMMLPAGPWSDTPNNPSHVVFISDPVAGANYILKVDNKTAERFTPPTRPQRQPRDANDSQRDKDAVTTSLGTQTIGGVSADGTRVTRTIPAGAIGNQSPIQIVTEKWYAPSLQMYVKIQRSDPRYGNTTYQLSSVQTSEPAISQFQVPTDYTVTARKGRGPRDGAPPPPQQ
jgi:hypothetical protein